MVEARCRRLDRHHGYVFSRIVFGCTHREGAPGGLVDGQHDRLRRGAAAGGLPTRGYSIGGMTWGAVELEPEVRDWLEGLSTTQFVTAAFYGEE